MYVSIIIIIIYQSIICLSSIYYLPIIYRSIIYYLSMYHLSSIGLTLHAPHTSPTRVHVGTHVRTQSGSHVGFSALSGTHPQRPACHLHPRLLAPLPPAFLPAFQPPRVTYFSPKTPRPSAVALRRRSPFPWLVLVPFSQGHSCWSFEKQLFQRGLGEVGPEQLSVGVGEEAHTRCQPAPGPTPCEEAQARVCGDLDHT